MPKVKPPKFARPGLLRKLKPSSLLDLFNPYRSYLTSRAFDLPTSNEATFDIEGLGLVLATSIETTPAQMLEELEMLEILSERQSLFDFEDHHCELVKRLRTDGDSDADIALKILRQEPDAAWEAFDKRAIKVRRVMTSYRTTNAVLPPTRDRLAKLERLMAPWFESNDRSEVCHVRALREDGAWSFVIRHGDPLARLGVITDSGESSSALLRPERLDIAFYSERTGEWQMSGIGKQLQELYRKSFGKILHGTPDALIRSSRYTLDPLRKGAGWLTAAGDVQAAALKELVFERPNCARVALSQCDVFSELSALGPSYVAACEFIEARLALKLRNRRAWVQVTIVPGRDSISGAVGLPAVDAWLADRQFATNHEHAEILAYR